MGSRGCLGGVLAHSEDRKMVGEREQDGRRRKAERSVLFVPCVVLFIGKPMRHLAHCGRKSILRLALRHQQKHARLPQFWVQHESTYLSERRRFEHLPKEGVWGKASQRLLPRAEASGDSRENPIITR